jgi:pimeloyl-ACP methyl ester carboxylesterase
LTIPEGKGPFPAFVMVTGSGLQNRDEEIFGFKIFRVIADQMARDGIATLRYDDRGAGGSTGNLTTATTEDLAGDALAGVELLSQRAEVDRKRIGVFGHSEGAAVAAIAAAKAPDSVGFIVLMAGAAVPGQVVLRQQAQDAARELGANDEQVARILTAHQKVLDAVVAEASPEALSGSVRELIIAQLEGRSAANRVPGDPATIASQMLPAAVASLNSPWMRYFVKMDPASFFAKVKCPVYAAFGAKDTQVPPSLHKAPLEAAFAKGSNSHLTVKVYPEANHLFIAAKTGSVLEYASLPKVFVPEFLDDIARFINAQRTR